MGMRYTVYRIRHEIEKKSGVLIKRHPMRGEVRHFISLAELRSLPFFFKTKEEMVLPKGLVPELMAKAKRILKGEVLFFSKEWWDLGLDYDWVSNPESKYRYDSTMHWSQISDLSSEAGDIKFVWEKSRFSYLLTLIRYDFHANEDLSEFVMTEIESWIDANPINQGPNWRCSQEISLRNLNWQIVLTYYKNSPALTEARWQKIQNVIYWSLHHVYNHINFSRIAVRNNHAITETLFLTLSELFFPFIPETKKWAKKGRKWFEEEIAYQIYEDGTFLQFSMNYHRVVIQLLTLGISVTEKANRPFSKMIYERAYKSTDFLYQCLQEESGWLPNYGSNDGALFFPFSDTDYRDYRSQLNSLHYLLTGIVLYEEEKLASEIEWWGITKGVNRHFAVLEKEDGIKEFSIGGYYLIRDDETFTFIRCGSHKDRPAQSDNLHLDIWVGDKNILRDSGTYKYNTTEEYCNYFTGTAAHNSVIVNGQSQMLKGSRFIWYFWTQSIAAKVTENIESYRFEGRISAFQHLDKTAIHKRAVSKLKGQHKWIIEDVVLGLKGMEKKQIWHHDNYCIQISAKEEQQVLKAESALSYKSDYYGQLNKGKATQFKFDSKITTVIAYNN